MNVKKFFAILMAVALSLSLCTVAFAEGETQYTDATSITVTKVYKLVGAGSSPAENFTLEQLGNGTVKSGDATSAPALGDITGAQFNEGAATADGAEATITINLPIYEKVGIYEYTLKEKVGTTAGVTYYSNNIKLVVTVINDTATGKLRIAAVHTESEESTKSDKFPNTYSAGTLNVKKTVTGNLGDKDKYFKFTVTLTGEEGKTYAESYQLSGGSYEDNPTSIEIGTPAEFYLKHDETVSIANLPYGVKYKVEEKTPEGYQLTKSNDTGSINSASVNATFTNDRGAEIDTGITTDSLPYALLLGIVTLLGAAMLIKRRTTDN